MTQRLTAHDEVKLAQHVVRGAGRGPRRESADGKLGIKRRLAGPDPLTICPPRPALRGSTSTSGRYWASAPCRLRLGERRDELVLAGCHEGTQWRVLFGQADQRPAVGSSASC